MVDTMQELKDGSKRRRCMRETGIAGLLGWGEKLIYLSNYANRTFAYVFQFPTSVATIDVF
jgi:hypothetical protein